MRQVWRLRSDLPNLRVALQVIINIIMLVLGNKSSRIVVKASTTGSLYFFRRNLWQVRSCSFCSRGLRKEAFCHLREQLWPILNNKLVAGLTMDCQSRYIWAINRISSRRAKWWHLPRLFLNLGEKSNLIIKIQLQWGPSRDKINKINLPSSRPSLQLKMLTITSNNTRMEYHQSLAKANNYHNRELRKKICCKINT